MSGPEPHQRHEAEPRAPAGRVVAPAPAAASTSQGFAVAGRRGAHAVIEALGNNLDGAHHDELRAAQRAVILQRTVVLIWISVFVMPSAIWSFVYFTAPAYFTL